MQYPIKGEKYPLIFSGGFAGKARNSASYQKYPVISHNYPRKLPVESAHFHKEARRGTARSAAREAELFALWG